jgi:hypothetical protein
MNSRRYFADGIRGSAQRRDPRPLGGLDIRLVIDNENSFFHAFTPLLVGGND